MQASGSLVAVIGLAFLTNTCSRAQTTAVASANESKTPVATSGQSAGTAGAIDPRAVKALGDMGAYLRTLKVFQVTSETTRDEVQDDGQQIQYGGHVDMLVQRPDRLRAEITSDRQQRFFFYDGKSFTLWARRLNFYATVPAPPTLKELGDRLEDRYGIEMPLADLFNWGAEGGNTADIKGAADVGPSQIDGVSCEHFAFRQADVDWQVWIQQGSYPLPRKLVITTTSDAARPQYSSILSWNLAPSYNDAAFMFDPPKDAHKIAFRDGAASQR